MVASDPPLTAPALVLVGALMIRSVANIDAADATGSVPAFLVLAGVPRTDSIPDGLALGFVAPPLLEILSGRAQEVRPAGVLLALALLGWFIVPRGTG